jgi:uncharacterized protein (TIGR02466 family)
MNIRNYTLFPSIVTETQCNLYKCIREDLINWIYNYQVNTESVILSNRGGWQSPSDFHKLESFYEFEEYILSHILQSLSYYKCNFNLSNMWININKKGDYNDAHDHPNSILSGVFWAKIPENCGRLVFNSPNGFAENTLLNSIDENIKQEHNYSSTFVFTPNEGTLILFPSHLQHFVEPNKSDEDRISIAFNLFV